jgi:hypothetical protein
MLEHTITARGPRGEPCQIVCKAHADCGWRRDLAGSPGPKDAIALALLDMHARQWTVATPTMMGHPRRRRD